MTKRPQKAPERTGINVRVPSHVHTAAKIAIVSRRITWDQAAAEAFEAWARAQVPTK